MRNKELQKQYRQQKYTEYAELAREWMERVNTKTLIRLVRVCTGKQATPESMRQMVRTGN